MISLKKIGLAAALIVVSSGAFAAKDGSFYVGAGLSQANNKDFSTVCDAQGATSCDDIHSALSAFAGYQINQYVAAEMGYAQLGKYSASSSGGSVKVAEGSGSAWEWDAVGMYPVMDSITLFARGGLAMTKVEVELPLTSYSESETSSNFVWGLGAQWKATDSVSWRGEYRMYSNVGDKDTTGEYDIDTVGISAVISF